MPIKDAGKSVQGKVTEFLKVLSNNISFPIVSFAVGKVDLSRHLPLASLEGGGLREAMTKRRSTCNLGKALSG